MRGYSLRNRNYITATMRMSSRGQLFNILEIVSILHTLEILTLLADLTTMRMTLGVSGVMQLAFLVSAQRWLVQSIVVMMSVIALAMAVVHAGIDFTF